MQYMFVSLQKNNYDYNLLPEVHTIVNYFKLIVIWELLHELF